MAGPTVVIFTGGEGAPDWKSWGAHVHSATSNPYVIAADSGLVAARTARVAVDLVIGDLDSVPAQALAAAEAAGATVVRHPATKDATDLELALDAALDLDPVAVLVVGGDGGRLDHVLANALVLTRPEFGDVELVACFGRARVWPLRPARRAAAIDGTPGELLTLLPVEGPAVGVTTTGLAYALDDATLGAGTSRGVSNVFTAARASVRLRSGTLLAIAPGEMAAPGSIPPEITIDLERYT